MPERFFSTAAPALRCRDDNNVDSPNHQFHTYSTAREGFSLAGPYPASHPVRMPQPAHETIRDTGYGTHADYVFGWKGDSLQRAMDSDCMFQGCGDSVLETQSGADMNECVVQNSVDEDVEGCKLSRACLGGAP
ncbi:hypothetical protein DL769_002115 [Monosporascus sp. CRB-8-3]|nr:hypothetical protein DL769_002115 [Monosporascus sp. CRB-8-3]